MAVKHIKQIKISIIIAATFEFLARMTFTNSYNILIIPIVAIIHNPTLLSQ